MSSVAVRATYWKMPLKINDTPTKVCVQLRTRHAWLSQFSVMPRWIPP